MVIIHNVAFNPAFITTMSLTSEEDQKKKGKLELTVKLTDEHYSFAFELGEQEKAIMAWKKAVTDWRENMRTLTWDNR